MQRKQKLKRIHLLPPINSSRAKIPMGLPRIENVLLTLTGVSNGNEDLRDMQKNTET